MTKFRKIRSAAKKKCEILGGELGLEIGLKIGKLDLRQ
jgi:hypothetical protein